MIVYPQPRLDANIVSLGAIAQMQHWSRRCRKYHQVMRGEIRGPLWLLVPAKISRAGVQREPNLAELARRQSGIGKLTNSNGQIKAVVNQIDHVIGEFGINPDLRIALQESTDPAVHY